MMLIAFGLWCALAGAVALLAGVTARRRAGRLRQRGIAAWATVFAAARTGDEFSPPGTETMIRYSLPDGRVSEQRCPPGIRRSNRLLPGEKVRVWYNPADPGDVLVSSRDGRYSDRTFAIAGIMLILAGVWIAGH
jgi:Protein of unknown function (DUF3592)